MKSAVEIDLNMSAIRCRGDGRVRGIEECTEHLGRLVRAVNALYPMGQVHANLVLRNEETNARRRPSLVAPCHRDRGIGS